MIDNETLVRITGSENELAKRVAEFWPAYKMTVNQARSVLNAANGLGDSAIIDAVAKFHSANLDANKPQWDGQDGILAIARRSAARGNDPQREDGFDHIRAWIRVWSGRDIPRGAPEHHRVWWHTWGGAYATELFDHDRVNDRFGACLGAWYDLSESWRAYERVWSITHINGMSKERETLPPWGRAWPATLTDRDRARRHAMLNRMGRYLEKLAIPGPNCRAKVAALHEALATERAGDGAAPRPEPDDCPY